MHHFVRVANDVRTFRDNELPFIGLLKVSLVQQLLNKILRILALRVLLLHGLKLLLERCDSFTLFLGLFRILTIQLVLELFLLKLVFDLGLRASPLAASLQEVCAITLTHYRWKATQHNERRKRVRENGTYLRC